MKYILIAIIFLFTIISSIAQKHNIPILKNDTLSILNYNENNEVIYLEINFLKNDKIFTEEFQTQIIDQSDLHGKAYLIEDNKLMIYYPYDGSFGLDSVIYEICDQNNNCVTAKVFIQAVNPNLVEIIIPSAFSPNNDGVNDFFFIQGIENYPVNEFIIFSRWGTKLYHRKNYSNENPWDGRYDNSNVKLGPDEIVPKGTYFYKIVIKEKNYVKSGYIIVKR